MRKILIAVLAALTAIAAVGIAQAQEESPGAEITVTVSPAKAGTKKKPKPTKVKLSVVNSDSTQTADGLQIFHPKQLVVSGKGLKKCSRAKLEQELDPSSCPRASKLGIGTADAIAGVNGASPTELNFNVTAFLIANKKIAFLIQQQGGSVNALAIGTFKKARGQYGSVLDVDIPEIARQIGTGPGASYNGLKALETTLYKKVGKKSLYKSTGCPSNRSLPFKTVIHFQANPNPPKAEEVEATAGANCRK